MQPAVVWTVNPVGIAEGQDVFHRIMLIASAEHIISRNEEDVFPSRMQKTHLKLRDVLTLKEGNGF